MNIKNNHILFTAIVLLIGTKAFAQSPLSEYYPIGTTWEEVLMPSNQYPGEVVNYPVDFVRYSFSVDRDTIIDERAYKVVNSNIIDCLEIPEGFYLSGNFFIREEGDSIYLNYVGAKECDELIYNFNWQEDMSVLISNTDRYNPQNLSFSQEVLLDGNTYDCYTKSYGIRKNIYKSIGQTVGGLILGMADGARYPCRFHLTKFTRNNVLIYENDIPTPQVNAIYDVSYKEKDESQNCYTLQGVKVDVNNLNPGIYIQNGRKFVVK